MTLEFNGFDAFCDTKDCWASERYIFGGEPDDLSYDGWEAAYEWLEKRGWGCTKDLILSCPACVEKARIEAEADESAKRGHLVAADGSILDTPMFEVSPT